ncbi:hypothetical protein [Prosthecobacter sp.]|jgi:hypothetical protein|uniref:hypothetical protein n=1 Tax=Prosthecobacter sp. TaxID=1965333 RepID=UPI003783F8D5
MRTCIVYCGLVAVVLTLSGCGAQWGLTEPGYGYPGALAAHAPRLGVTHNYTYFPRYEAYYHHPTRQFHYPDGETWKIQPKLPNAEARDVFSTPGVSFCFDQAPSDYHWMVKRAYPPSWSPGTGRNKDMQAWGRSGWDIERR